ncbi:hypothetical protein MRO55_25570, partial [Escherichia coli]|uniref:hypothetical protein n=1 Tax=Escherichia coli TaxID=562 RepID=UPI00211576E1
VAFLPGDGEERAVLVYSFYPGRPWDGDVRDVARLQRRQHAVAADGFRAVPRDPAGITAQGDALLAAAGDVPGSAELRGRRPAGRA